LSLKQFEKILLLKTYLIYLPVRELQQQGISYLEREREGRERGGGQAVSRQAYSRFGRDREVEGGDRDTET
jgi:hypothetical protein